MVGVVGSSIQSKTGGSLSIKELVDGFHTNAGIGSTLNWFRGTLISK